LSILLLAFFSFVVAQEEKPKEEKKDEKKQAGINWKNGIDLYNVTLWMQKETGKKFIFADESIKTRKIYLVSDKPIEKPEDKFEVYQSVLQMLGYVLIKVGQGDTEMYKIIALEKSSTYPAENATGKEKPKDRYVTQVFALKYFSPQEVLTTLAALSSNPRGLIKIDASKIIIVSDYDYNIERFAKIIETMDVKRPDIVMEMIQLKNSLATDAEQVIKALVQTIIQRAQRDRGPGVQEVIQVMSDKRTNSIVVLAEPDRMEQIKELIAKLDANVGFQTTDIFVYHLNYVNADEVAKTLGSIFKQPAQGGGMPSLSAPIIVEDKITNSLIVVADRNIAQDIEGLIQKLD